MRSPATTLLEKAEQQHANEEEFEINPVHLLSIDLIEVDNCPSQLEDGTVIMGLAFQASIDLESTSLTEIPDLVVREGPC